MAAKKKTYPTYNPEQVPEVREYEIANRAVELYVEDNKRVFDEYHQLIEEANQKLQAADAKVRELQANCGEFKVYKTLTKYDTEKLRSIVGDAKFMEYGGSYKTQVVWEIDRARLEQLIELGTIPPEITEIVRTETVQFSNPKPR